MYCIGLTGGIATGKSTVVEMLKKLGAYVIDCDQLARQVVMPGSAGLAEVVQIFGTKAVNRDGTMNRPYVASVVFLHQEYKKKLEQALYPKMQVMIDDMTAAIQKKDHAAVVFLDMPLLFEIKYEAYVAEAWLVYVDPQTQLRRLMVRNQYTEDEALARIRAQLPIDVKRSLAQVIIDNTGSLAETEEQVQREWKRLKARIKSGE